MAFFGLGLVFKEIRLDSDSDIPGDFFVAMFGHARGSTVTFVVTELAMKQPSCA